MAAPPFSQACRRAVRLQVGAVDHDRVPIRAGLGQVAEDAGEYAQTGPPGKAVVEGLVRPVDSWRILPAQTVTQDVEDTTEDPSIIHPGLAPRLREMRPQPLNLFARQPELSAYATPHIRAA